MKNLFFFYFLIFICFFNQSSANIQNKIILKIENEIITNYEIKNKILTTLVLAGDEINQMNIDKSKKQALDSLIQLKLKKIELSKYNIPKNTKIINQYLMSVSSNNVESLKNKFEDNNLDFQQFLDEIEIQTKWQKFIYEMYSSKIQLDENSINKNLENLIKNNEEVKEYKISEIEIPFENDTNFQNEIDSVKSQITKLGFGPTALKYSVSSTASKQGLLGWINSKTLSPQVYEIISQMQPGEISEPIKRQNTILFLKLIESRISKVKNVDTEELKNNLISQKKNELFNLYSRSHLSKLKNNILIEYK
tara:strand:- start:14747 stop:15670 length:924 start_codon:yes stop_codon:yes gene_type:complete